MPTGNADVTVVGSGMLGLAVAHELLNRGLSITVVGPRDPTHLGQASRAAGAMLTVFSEVEHGQPLDRVELEVGQRIAARRLYETWLADLASTSGLPIDLIPGVWVIANAYGAHDQLHLEAIRAAAHRHDWQADDATPADVPGLVPQVRASDALWLPGEATVNPVQVMAALEAAVVGNLPFQRIDANVDDIREHGDHLLVTADTGATALSAHVVVAAGAGSERLLHESLAATVGLPSVLAGRGVSMLVDAPFELPAAIRTPNRGFACGTHVVPRGDGRLYLGATNRLSTEPDSTRPPNLDEIATLIHDGAAELHTDLRNAGLASVRVGNRPVTFDHLPLLGTTGHPMIHAATATYRCGVLLAPLAAKIVADCITRPGSHADHPYRPTRPVAHPKLVDLLAATGTGLVDMLCQPGGQLPPGTDKQLAAILHVALAELATAPGARAAVVNRIWRRAPMIETIPLVAAAIGRLA